MASSRWLSRVFVLSGFLLALLFPGLGAQAQEATGTLEGTVTDSETTEGVGNICVFARVQGSEFRGEAITDAQGDYSMEAEAGQNQVWLRECSEDREPHYKGAGNDPNAGPQLPTTGAGVGDYLLFTFFLLGGGAALTLVARRSGYGTLRPKLLVCWLCAGVVAAGSLVTGPEAAAQNQFAWEVEEDETTEADFVLDRFGGLSGVVTSAETAQPVEDVCVLFGESAESLDRSTTTGPDGSFSAPDVEPGEYVVAYQGCSDDIQAGFVYRGGSLDPADAQSVSVTRGNMTQASSTITTNPGSISGAVGTEEGTFVCVYARNSTRRTMASARPGEDGRYTMTRVPAGAYQVEFEDCGGGDVETQYWDGKSSVEEADDVAVAAGQNRTGINAAMGADPPDDDDDDNGNGDNGNGDNGNGDNGNGDNGNGDNGNGDNGNGDNGNGDNGNGDNGNGQPTPTPVGQTPGPQPTPTPAPGTPPPGEEIALSSTVVSPGGTMTAIADGFMPGSEAVGTVFSTPREVGRAVADSTGRVVLSFVVPMDLEPGTHTLEIRGIDPDGRERVVTRTFRVAGTPASPARLPGTGASILLLLLAGAGMMAGGSALASGTRRRKARG